MLGLVLVAAFVVVLAALGYIGWILALPALGLLAAVLFGYAMRVRGPE